MGTSVDLLGSADGHCHMEVIVYSRTGCGEKVSWEIGELMAHCQIG